MAQPVLTIGMAVHEDYHGTFFTVNALRLYHDVHDCELIVVDNSPNTPSGKDTKQMVENCAPGWQSARYIAAPEVLGTSAPRNRVFTEASGNAVVCMDCHVLLVNGAVDRLKAYYKAHPDTNDLLSGPMIFDNLVETATHFSPRWREEMEGTWGLAWRCKCGQTIDVIDEPSQVTTMYRALMSDTPYKTEYRCNCGAIAPACEWGGHEHRLIENGWQPTGMRPNDDPFEIPGQGLGLFTCRKEAWLGFNRHFKGFGGEELYIHRKYRKAGRKNLCLPFLGWYHRFGRPEQPRYDLERYSKARNYVLGHLELGMSLDPVKSHFVIPLGKLTASEWAHLVVDPIKNEKSPGCGTCGGGAPKTDDDLLRDAKNEITDPERDRFAQLCTDQRVTIWAKRDWWPAVARLGKAKSVTFFNSNAPSGIPDIEETDLLVIHAIHHADHLYAELVKMAPKTTRIFLRSTQTFGEQSELPNAPGLLPAMRRYMNEHPEWHVVQHSSASWGYTVLSRAPEDKKKLPGVIATAKNFAGAMAAHVADGMIKVSKEELTRRLNICTLCEHRVEDRCSICSCFLSAKAAMRSSACPLLLWDIDKSEPATSA